LFASFAPFSFRLRGPRRFPGVLYLAPEPPDPFIRLTRLVHELWPAHPPYGGAFEGVIPHLTVADCEVPGACEDPDAVMDEVERAIVEAVPIEARAAEVWLMTGDDRWTLRRRFLLGG
jgi:hypothetical protein